MVTKVWEYLSTYWCNFEWLRLRFKLCPWSLIHNLSQGIYHWNPKIKRPEWSRSFCSGGSCCWPVEVPQHVGMSLFTHSDDTTMDVLFCMVDKNTVGIDFSSQGCIVYWLGTSGDESGSWMFPLLKSDKNSNIIVKTSHGATTTWNKRYLLTYRSDGPVGWTLK